MNGHFKVFTLRFNKNDLLINSFESDILRLVDISLLPSFPEENLPQIVPSYTLMKYIELCAIASSQELLQPNEYSLGYDLNIKSKAPIYCDDEISIHVSTTLRKRKIFFFEIDVFKESNLVTHVTHKRYVKKIK